MNRAVVYCVNCEFINLTAISIASLCKNYDVNSDSLKILVLVDHIENNDIDTLKKIPNIYNVKNISIDIWSKTVLFSEEIINPVLKKKQVMFWRLFVPQAFSNYEQILYLDNDTVINCDINNVFDLSDSEAPVSAAKDFYFYTVGNTRNDQERLTVDPTNYFNSGVLVFNVASYIYQIDQDTLVSMINDNRYPYLDQTILNVLFENKIGELPLECNYEKPDDWLFKWANIINPMIGQEIIKARKNILIRHFVENQDCTKPWQHLTNLDRWDNYFWDYFWTIKNFDYR